MVGKRIGGWAPSATSGESQQINIIALNSLEDFPLQCPTEYLRNDAFGLYQNHYVLCHSHSMKNGLETRQHQRTSVLSSIITWEVCWTSLKMTMHSDFDWLKRC